MFVKDVVMLACRELGLDEVTDEIKSAEKVETLSTSSASSEAIYSDGVQKEIEKIIDCINLAVETITSSEAPIVAEERVTTDAEGKVSLENFSKGVYEVLDAVNENTNESADFMLMPFHLYLPSKNTSFLVRYRAGGKPVTGLDDQIEVAPFIGVGVITRAVVYEYLLSKNCYTEATFWKESFEDALEKVKIKNRKYRFKSRGII